MIDKDYIYKNMPDNKKVDDFYVLELKLDNNKIKELGYSHRKIYSYISKLFKDAGYILGKNEFWFATNRNMFSFSEILDLAKEKWFREFVNHAYVYRRFNNNVDQWYCNDYAKEAIAIHLNENIMVN
jgi:hypothetical protein